MAKRAVFISLKQHLVNKVARQLQLLQDCHSNHTTLCYGVFASGSQVQICTEYMDKGSFAAISKKHGPLDLGVVGKVALAVLHGLAYLYDEHRIIHRNIKPSNILLNSQGEIKICDFAIYDVLEEHIPAPIILDDFSIYQSPERIQNIPFTPTADTWSLGITLIELVQGRHPYEELELSVVELLHHIVNEPAPRIRFDGKPSALCDDFVYACLVKDARIRPAPKAMLEVDVGLETWLDREV
ncbi:MAP kinase kinase (MEK) [Ceratobasidium sp. 428]|nr:MAP kinase kinase (MEK) [Ceratobasidium sp. 428]